MAVDMIFILVGCATFIRKRVMKNDRSLIQIVILSPITISQLVGPGIFSLNVYIDAYSSSFQLKSIYTYLAFFW